MPGGGVARFTDAAEAIVFGGQTFKPLSFKITGRQQSLGVSVDACEIEVDARTTDNYNGQPLTALAARNGFLGAEATITRMYGIDWDTLRSSPVGSFVLFSGRCSETPSGGALGFTLRIASWTELLDTSSYVENYSPACRNSLFDLRCGVSKAAYAQSVVIGAGSTAISLNTNISAATGFYDRGFIAITSGVCAGQQRAVRTQVGGVVTLLPGLTAAPAGGDTATIYPGCARTLGDCAKYNNTARFRGEPFIPAPETAV